MQTVRQDRPHITSFRQSCGNEVGVRVFGAARRKAAPLLVYFHGGLFNSGTVEAAADLARALQKNIVVSCIDYPLAPALQFPATVEVAFDALSWAAANASALKAAGHRIYVGGDEAGGNLAAAVAMMARDRGLKPGHARLAGQILINPMLDPRQSTPSMQAAEDCPCRQGWRDYLSCISDTLHPYAAPVLSSRLAGLPPALVISAQRDPLRDEAEQYAGRLIAAGVPVQMRRLGGPGGSPVQSGHPDFRQLVQLVGQFLIDGA
jgi:acetyl esterase/lipase